MLPMSVCIAILFCSTIIKMAVGKATFEVQMLQFSNPSGEKGDGNCCDLCLSDCDNQFIFCLDQVRDTINTDHNVCSYVQHETGEFDGGNSVTFTNDMKGIQNPIRIQLSGTDTVILKVRVLDIDDPLDDEWLDTVYGSLVVKVFGRTSGVRWVQAEVNGQRAGNPTTLTLQYRGYCNPNYYGELCGIHCKEEDSDSEGHYTCDPLEGSIECREGWVFPESSCKTRDNPCTPTTCSNGGTCTGGEGTFTCTCPGRYTGFTCDSVDECADEPCQNGGTCVTEAGGYTCLCLAQYTGRICESMTTDACSSQPCMNKGTCASLVDSYTCICPDDYSGRRCEQSMFDPCSGQPCQNNGTCIGFAEGYTCSCPDVYEGRHCDTYRNPCEPNPCQNEAECMIIDRAFYCVCSEIFTGENCSELVTVAPCDTVCNNGGVCVSQGFCECLPCFNGPQCNTSVCNNTTGAASLSPNTGRDIPTTWIAVACVAFVVIVVVIIVVVLVVRRQRMNRNGQANGVLQSPDASNVKTPPDDVETPADMESPPASPTDRYVRTPSNTMEKKVDPIANDYSEINEAQLGQIVEHPYVEVLGENSGNDRRAQRVAGPVDESYMETRDHRKSTEESRICAGAGEVATMNREPNDESPAEGDVLNSPAAEDEDTQCKAGDIQMRPMNGEGLAVQNGEEERYVQPMKISRPAAQDESGYMEPVKTSDPSSSPTV